MLSDMQPALSGLTYDAVGLQLASARRRRAAHKRRRKPGNPPRGRPLVYACSVAESNQAQSATSQHAPGAALAWLFSGLVAAMLLASLPAAANPVADLLAPKTEPSTQTPASANGSDTVGTEDDSANSLPKPEPSAAPASGVTPIYTEDTDQITLDNLLSEAMSFIKGAPSPHSNGST